MHYDLINAIRLLSPGEQGKRKDVNSEQRLRQSKCTRRGTAARAAAGLFIKQWLRALPAVVVLWNYFLIFLWNYFLTFLSFFYNFQTFITSLLSESVSTSTIHHKPRYFLFLAPPGFKALPGHPHGAPGHYCCLVQSNLSWEAVATFF